MNEDYVTFEQAVQLKELGFDWETHAFYSENCELYSSKYPENWSGKIWESLSAPTLAQAQKWLREVKGIDVLVIKERRFDAFYKVICLTNNFETWAIKQQPSNYDMYSSDTYEQSLSAGIDKALKFLILNLKKKTNDTRTTRQALE